MKAPTKIQPGFRIRNPQTGEVKMWSGKKWEDAPAAAGSMLPGAPFTPGRQMDPADEKRLAGMNEASRAAPFVDEIYNRAEKAIDKFQPGPYRGMFYDALIPEQGGGFWDGVGGAIGSVARAAGVLSEEDVKNFQMLKGAQAQRVLEVLKDQKGVQTEGDAVRAMLSDVGPFKSVDENKQLLQESRVKTSQAPSRARFYQQWARTYGLSGLDPKGQDVEGAYREWLSSQQARRSAAGAPAPATAPQEEIVIRRVK